MRAGTAAFARNKFTADSWLSDCSSLEQGGHWVHTHQPDAWQRGRDIVRLSDRGRNE